MQEEITAAQKLIDTVIEFCVNYGFQAFGAIIVLVLGLIVANVVAKGVLKLCERKKIDIVLSKFMSGTVRLIIIGFVLLIALGKFGITIAPFVAALGALAFGASFALQGPLANYGAGIALIMSRPFTEWDTISVAGVSGVVQEVRLSCTLLTDEEGVTITIPNKCIVGEILHNSKGNKLVDGIVGISYGADPDSAIAVIKKVLKEDQEVVKGKNPLIGIKSFGDSSIDIAYRYWVPTIKYFQVRGGINLKIFKALNNAKIEIPFPQHEVTIINSGK